MSLSVKENPPTCFAFNNGECAKGKACDLGIHLSVKKEFANLGMSMLSSILNMLMANQRSEIMYVVIAKTLDLTQAEDNITLTRSSDCLASQNDL